MVLKFTKPTRSVKKIFIHCSDSDVKSHDNIETIRQWHVVENGWSDIGYHFFITKDGEINEARPIDKVPSAQRGHNTGSIAICLSGKEKFTSEQFESLNEFLAEIEKEYDNCLPVFGHKDVDSSKTCPNFEVKEKLRLDDDNFFLGKN